MKLVSAIITTHKREPKIIERALISVLNQTYANIEIIVVDDSPADYSKRAAVRETVERHGVKYIAHECCQGACVARNTGVQNCLGEFVAFLDDDDEWKPEKIERQMLLMNDPHVALVYCGYENLFEATGEKVERNKAFYRGYVFDRLIRENFIGSTSFPLIRKDALLTVGGFDPEMESAQDLDLWLRLAKQYQIDYIKESLVVYHFHEGEQITKNPKRKILGLERIIEKNGEYLEVNPQVWWERKSKVIPFYIMDGQLEKAIVVWWQCVKKCPSNLVGNTNNIILLLKVFIARKLGKC